MSDSLELLKKRMNAGTVQSAVAAPEDADEDSCIAFGYLRGIRDRALTLEFRLADGNSIAFPYNWLGPCKYNPSSGILLKFVGDMIYLVLVEGSNLNALVKDGANLYQRGIQRHRVTWIREMTVQQVGRAGPGEVTIERIRTLSHRPDDEPAGIAWLEPFRELENRR
jgi:hypothetical protein